MSGTEKTETPENLVEVSYEVANKVGGIYQVLKSKAGQMKRKYGENYVTVGYYDEENARKDFAKRSTHDFQDIFDEMEEELGVKCTYGVWKIDHNPSCILVDAKNMKKDVDEIKKEFWERYKIDSLNSGPMFEDPLKWAFAVGRLVEKLSEKFEGETVLHAHEWLSAPAIFESSVPSVFTTHATVLGRALSNSGRDVVSMVENSEVNDDMVENVSHRYTRLSNLEKSFGENIAEQYGVKSRHQMEKTGAIEADVFTTVSEVTSEEAHAVLGVKPDRVLPNGFNVDEFPSLEELSYQHKKKKERMKSFLRAYFEPYYSVELEKDPRILFISGRYEFHNKGIDAFIDALGKLNKKEGDDFFVFIFVPADVMGERLDVLENVSLYDELEDYIDSMLPDLKTELLDKITSGENVEEFVKNWLANSHELEVIRQNFHAKRGGVPPLCAYSLNYDNDDIMERLMSEELYNREEDRVKIIFYPTYLKRGDKMLSMSYEDAIKATSAGIFPSYYEPWGYTPVETAASGCLSLTTDLAGFGQYLMEHSDMEKPGIEVVKRKDVPYEDFVDSLAEKIEAFVNYTKTEITERKHNARKAVQLTSWNRLVDNYYVSHSMALERSKND